MVIMEEACTYHGSYSINSDRPDGNERRLHLHDSEGDLRGAINLERQEDICLEPPKLC
jgi:hypothetical protein